MDGLGQFYARTYRVYNLFRRISIGLLVGCAVSNTTLMERTSYEINDDRSVDVVYSYNEWDEHVDYKVHMELNPHYDKAHDYFTYYYTIKYVEKIGDQTGENTPFYGIWCGASKDRSEAESIVSSMNEKGLPAEIFVTTDWSNLNTERWYVVSAGTYNSQEEAENSLPQVKEYFANAYVKYSGDYTQ